MKMKPAKRANSQADMSKLENEIDQLYGLTPTGDEIGIVEGTRP